MAQLWAPLNITPACLEQSAPLTQCSQTGMMYLSLIVQLFGQTTRSVSKNLFEINSDVRQRNQFSSIKEHGMPRDRSFRYPFGKNSSTDFDSICNKTYQDTNVTVTNTKVKLTEDKKNKRSRRKREAVETYDFIVVGAGSAGCVVANRLSEVKRWKVLLLEAGPEEPDVTSVPALAPVLCGSSVDWLYRTQPEKMSCRAWKEQTCPSVRGKMMGGCSSLNFMVYMRGNRRDYDGWAELGNPGWSYREVLPYFKKSENNQELGARNKYYYSVGGPINVERYPYTDATSLMIVQAFRERGLSLTDFNGENQIGTNIAQSTSMNGQRFSVNSAYIKPIRHVRHNLKIVTNAFATKLLIDPITKTAFGVQYVKNGILYTVRASKEVIVSSGAINSPKLLMLSGVGPKHHLESLNISVVSDLSVGHNLQDHVTTEALIVSLSNKTSTILSQPQLINEIYKYHYQHPLKNGPLAFTGTVSSTAFIKTHLATEDAPDIQFHFDGKNVAEFYSDPSTYLATNVFPLSFYNSIAPRPLLLLPKSRGFILLNNTDPVFGPPLIYPRFFTEREDIDVILAAIRFFLRMEETPAFKSNGAKFVKIPVKACSKYQWGTDEYFTCLLTHYTATIFHPVSTCKMGPRWDKEAVVDPRLRVYGVNKLRVIDASIMPRIIRGNTNMPTVMIAEKGSDLIKEEWLIY